MRDSGTTLLYVSHSAESVKSVCEKALWLNKGESVMEGTAEEVMDQYIKFLER